MVSFALFITLCALPNLFAFLLAMNYRPRGEWTRWSFVLFLTFLHFLGFFLLSAVALSRSVMYFGEWFSPWWGSVLVCAISSTLSMVVALAIDAWRNPDQYAEGWAHICGAYVGIIFLYILYTLGSETPHEQVSLHFTQFATTSVSCLTFSVG